MDFEVLMDFVMFTIFMEVILRDFIKACMDVILRCGES